MKVDVTQILKTPGASMPFQVEGLPSTNGDTGPGEGGKADGPFAVRGVATSLGDRVHVEAHARGSVRLQCSRCLRPFTKVLSLRCEGVFARDLEGTLSEDKEEDLEVFPLSGGVIDLGEMVGHEVVLNIPMKPLCSPDCKGLCPICGADLSLGDCGCARPEGGEPEGAFGRKLREALDERGKRRGRS